MDSFVFNRTSKPSYEWHPVPACIHTQYYIQFLDVFLIVFFAVETHPLTSYAYDVNERKGGGQFIQRMKNEADIWKKQRQSLHNFLDLGSITFLSLWNVSILECHEMALYPHDGFNGLHLVGFLVLVTKSFLMNKIEKKLSQKL